ncbi:UPF0602 protein C4orf47 homolog [Uloborus diversus]|uniref:UPF0602 protein C4orf47 homolog n=1 Tax=Uloborus diversus TaxID=327109 RepID=UPI0024092DD3|nr:UPF0602 protein C4orf47 homolog [Uloborus diversus]
MAVEEERKGPDFERIGLFKEMSYHTEYIAPRVVFNESSKKGAQMMTNATRSKSGNQDGYFAEEFQRAFEGEALADPIRLRRKNRIEQAAKNLPPGHFKQSSPAKKPSGKGSLYGTIGGPIEYFNSQTREREKTEPPPKNVLVNPAQKGTGYGYPNVTIGKPPPYFMEDEYETLKNTPATPKKVEPRPFPPYRAGLFQQGFFDTNPWKCIEEQEIKEPAEKEEKTFRPYIPPGPSKKDGGMKAGCFSPFPEWVGDPVPTVEGVPRGVRHYLNAQNQMFRPVPGPKPYPVKSIITKNIQK